MENNILKLFVTFGVIIFAVSEDAHANTQVVHQIGGVIIPEAFSNALRDSMSIPLYLHLDGSNETQNQQRIGSASILLDDTKLRVHLIRLEDKEGNASLNEQTRNELTELSNTPFDKNFKISLTPDAWLQLNFRQLTLHLVIRRQALTTVLRPRGEDIGKSSADSLSSTLNYNIGAYSNRMRNGGGSTSSSYLALNNVTALREHHVLLDGTLYSLGTPAQQADIYKAMYERDFAGYRFAGGMLDSWNLQSLGPITAISSGQIYGASWGNQANSTAFDNTNSVTPVIVFLPAAGEVQLRRDGKLLSVQNFAMGNHEVDTRSLPYGIYDVSVETIVNGRVVSNNIQRINKLFSRERGAGIPLIWQIWGGEMHLESWSQENGDIHPAKNTVLAGISAAGGIQALNWAASSYHYNAVTVGEMHFSWPVSEYFSLSTQNMAATDHSWSAISSLSVSLPGGFSSLWLSQEKTVFHPKIRRSSANTRAVGASLNLNFLWSKLGTLSANFNDDRRHNTHYYTADYTQSLFNGKYGSLGLRAGLQRYNSGYDYSATNTQKYIALDFTLPLGNWFRVGMTNQNGYTMANLSAQKQLSDGIIRTVGADLSRTIAGDAGDNETLSGGVWTKYDTRYSSGTLNINSGADGYLNANLTSSGSLGWEGKNIGASGSSEGNAGVIFRTDVEDDGRLTARVNGRAFPLTGKRNYLSLEPYKHYEVEIQNYKDSLDSYDIASGRKSHITLYPGNVVLISPEVKQMITVSGRIHAEDGTLITNARINNHIGRARTDEHGEFVMDIDKKFPTIDFTAENNNSCEVNLQVSHARGAVWVGDIVCQGLKTYVTRMPAGAHHEG
ncbi:CS1-pili formation C-terminal domain-containing protein [Vagococcus sp. WN89Y]|uniref:CS1-pili formation C-terminal domain-containing protein n=1 Tax=Vagococcus sp. WN89Y TaxID=3457258 RepID=UPI003FCD84D5